MADINIEYKIELMLKIYRDRLEKAASVNDFTLAMRTEAQISVLEMLYYYAVQNGYQPTAYERGQEG